MYLSVMWSCQKSTDSYPTETNDTTKQKLFFKYLLNASQNQNTPHLSLSSLTRKAHSFFFFFLVASLYFFFSFFFFFFLCCPLHVTFSLGWKLAIIDSSLDGTWESLTQIIICFN